MMRRLCRHLSETCSSVGLTSQPLSSLKICEKVLSAFEKVHVGMDGLQYESAKFPNHEGYSIVQRSIGFGGSVNCIEDWIASNDNDKVIKKSYWAT